LIFTALKIVQTSITFTKQYGLVPCNANYLLSRTGSTREIIAIVKNLHALSSPE
jgi:hypothetical protein